MFYRFNKVIKSESFQLLLLRVYRQTEFQHSQLKGALASCPPGSDSAILMFQHEAQ